MRFKIDKPLVIVKVHTTGLDTKMDRIVAFTITKHDKDGGHKTGTRLINPECHIPQEATAIHGITNDMVEKEKTFGEVAQGLFTFINDADIAGFNVRFDVEMLMAEFARCGLDYVVYTRKLIDLYEVYTKLNPRTFAAAVKQYVNPSFQEGEVVSTEKNVELLDRMMHTMLGGDNAAPLMDEIKNLGINPQTLDVRGLFTTNEDNRAVFNMGKHKGKLVAEVLLSDKGYYDWLRDKADFPKDVTTLAEIIIKKHKNAQAQNA